jgi:hypothetical protein
MRRARVLSAAAAVTQEKALETANNLEPHFAAKTGAPIIAHRFDALRCADADQPAGMGRTGMTSTDSPGKIVKCG